MSYSPAFQSVLDKCTALSESGKSLGEIQACFYDNVKALGPYERLNNLYRIRTKRSDPKEKSRLQFFKMNRMQEEFWKTKTNRDLVLKMRQGGVTTFSCLIALDKALWEDGTHSAIMAHVRDNVKKFFRISKTAFLCFQKDWGWAYPVTQKIDNVNELQINETGSELIVCTEAKGLTLDFLHISEACFVDDDRISESLEAVPYSGWVIMESTPNVAAGKFYDLWDLCERGEQCVFTAHFFPPWFQYPEPEDLPVLIFPPDFKLTDAEEVLVKQHNLTNEYILWRRMKISESGGNLGEYRKKYPEDSATAFLSGSNSVFSVETLAALWKSERLPAFVGDLVSE